jgi:hypothetical protein
MPIRFYCPFCDQLLGISSKKAGAVIECPSCHGQVGVPAEGAPPPLPAPLPAPAGVAQSHIVLTPAQVGTLAVVFLILACIAFAAGLLVGALI